MAKEEISNLKHLIEVQSKIQECNEKIIAEYKDEVKMLKEMLRKKTNALSMYHSIAGTDIDFKKTPEELKHMYFDICYENGLSIPEGFYLDDTKL